MFSHIFSYRLKTILRDREMVFWAMVFPLLMATLFKIAFANITAAGTILPVPLAVITDAAYHDDQVLQETLLRVSRSDQPLLELFPVSREEAEALLFNDEVAGYLEAGRPLRLHVTSSGIKQSILRTFLDQYSQYQSTAETIISRNPEALDEFISQMERQISYATPQPLGRNQPDQVLVFYFALLAMACFYGCYYGLIEAKEIQANLSYRAARVNMSPVHKLKAFLASSAASLTIHFSAQILLLMYLRFILKVDFAEQFLFVLVACFTGCVLSLALGALIGSGLKVSENLKDGIATAIGLVGSFLAGLMYPGMKQIVSVHFPVMKWINPVGILADSYFALFFYEGYSRYFLNLTLLLTFTLIFITAVYLLIRKRHYDSI